MRISRINKRISAGALVILAGVALPSYVAFAALTANSTLEQEVAVGTLSTDFRTSAGVLVNNPTFTMNPVTVSNAQQTATGTFGETEKRIAVDNPDAADDGWTLTLNASNPATDEWTSSGDSYKFNAATAADGQLTVDPSGGTLTAVAGGTTGISKGSVATFNSTSPVTLMSASAGAADLTNTTLYGVSLSQTIPASTPAGSYSLTMVQTVAAV